MNLVKKLMGACLLLLALTVLSVPALAAGLTEDGAPQDWTEAEEADRREDCGTAPAALTRLDTPSELEWGVDYHRFAETGQRTEIPGMFSWKLGNLRQYHYKVCIYRTGGGEDQLVDVTERWYGGDRDGNAELADGSRRASCFRFLLQDRESGDYYFTVQALGDGNEYESSGTAKSPVWHYEKPAARLESASRPAYDEENRLFSWSVADIGPAIGSYTQFYYSAEENGSIQEAGNGSVHTKVPNQRNTVRLTDLALEECGSGWYCVRVRLLSGEVDTTDSSAWSEFSEPVYIESNSEKLSGLVENLTEESTDEEKQAAVEEARRMDAYALSQLMAADRENTGAAGRIAQLEELTGTKAGVEVSETLSDELDRGKISVIGAGLNADVGETVSLKVGEPDPDAIIPTMYSNTLQFSMNLEKRTDDPQTVALRVPVKITLPLPAYINPDHLVILHHHANGSYEEVFEPYVHQGEDGQWLATFVVRSFSTFTLAEVRLTADQIPTGAEISFLPLKRDGAASCLCALYDKDGRLLGVQEAGLNGRQTLRFACDTSAPETGKLLYLDENSCPVGAAEDFTVAKG